MNTVPGPRKIIIIFTRGYPPGSQTAPHSPAKIVGSRRGFSCATSGLRRVATNLLACAMQPSVAQLDCPNGHGHNSPLCSAAAVPKHVVPPRLRQQPTLAAAAAAVLQQRWQLLTRRPRPRPPHHLLTKQDPSAALTMLNSELRQRQNSEYWSSRRRLQVAPTWRSVLGSGPGQINNYSSGHYWSHLT
jgi:hypothetical protein